LGALLISSIPLITLIPPVNAANAEISFQEGVNGYEGAVDTFIMEDEGDSDISHGALESLEWDADDPYNSGMLKFALIRFEDIIGPDPGQIPVGAFIESATFSYVVYNTGNPADVNEVLVDWTEDETYSSFGGEAGVQSDEYGTYADQANGASSGVKTIDVTSSLIAWAIDPSINYGWIFLPTGSDGVDIRSSEYGIIGDRPKLIVHYNTEPPSIPPDTPTLNTPINGAVNVSTSPTLVVTVTDPDGDTMDVTFYGREVGETSPGADFTIIALPDTQYESQYYPAVFTSQTQWIVDNEIANNIIFITHLGDIVQTANNETQWINADTAMDFLDPAGIPYSVGPGNHDLPLYSSPSYYNDYFGIDRFSGKSWYGGHYGSDNYNNYSLFSASGLDFILINLQYSPTSAMLDWADALLKANADRRGIVVSHSILTINDAFTSEGTTIYNALKDNPNLFLMLCGHMHGTSDGAAYLSKLGDDGHTIHIVLADYQDYDNGGDGYLRILRFSPADNKIYATTYSPYQNAYIESYPDEMEMEYEMTESAPFELIGSVSDVADGSNASIAWPGLLPETEYEWKVAVSDGAKTTDGPVWSFTTTVGLAGDFNNDCDVDGADLALLIARLIAEPESENIGVFAGAFGTVCP